MTAIYLLLGMSKQTKVSFFLLTNNLAQRSCKTSKDFFNKLSVFFWSLQNNAIQIALNCLMIFSIKFFIIFIASKNFCLVITQKNLPHGQVFNGCNFCLQNLAVKILLSFFKESTKVSFNRQIIYKQSLNSKLLRLLKSVYQNLEDWEGVFTRKKR